MIAAKWERIKDLFEAALDHSEQERHSFLARLETEDPEVAGELIKLLRSYEDAGDFLVHPCTLASDFLEDLEVEQHRFRPDDVLCGRFRIVHLIGQGGMGEVYKAWDQELEDYVALKTLRLEISAHELFTSRFRREIQLARKVTHPNVCRIFDSFKHPTGDGYISVLSMELLQGQNLAKYLKARGRLTVSEALPIARQIISGLSAIHAAGILHRDLKPANLVMVPGSGARQGTATKSPEDNNSGPAGGAFQVKITDFGIAGQIPEGLSTTAQSEASKLLGTPDYMAPEQLELGKASVQSDIYAAGLILYEMVTGKKAFSDGSAWTRLTADPPPPRKLAPGLPENWNKTIVCCLERNPEYRFPNAQAVNDALEGTAISGIVRMKPLLLRLKHVARSNTGSIAVVFLLMMALAAGVYRYLNQKPKVPAGSTVLMTEINSAEINFSGITLALRDQLAQSTHFQVADESRTTDLLNQMDPNPNNLNAPGIAEEVARRGAFPVIVSGSFFRNDQGYVLSVKIESVNGTWLSSHRVWKQDFVARDFAEILQTVNRAAVWIRTNLGEPATELSAHNTPFVNERMEAFQRLYDADQKYKINQYDDSIVLLKEALHFDPDFAMAHARMADILISLKRYNEGYTEWLRAIQLTDKQAFASRSNLRIKGQYYEDIGDYSAAEQAFRSMTIHYPNDPMSWFYLGSILDTLDRKEDAITAFLHSASLDPASYVAPVHLATLYLLLGRFADAQTQIHKTRKLGGSEWATWLEAHSAFLRGEHDAALQQIQMLQQSPLKEWKSKSYTYAANFQAELGRIADAKQTLAAGISFDQAHRRGIDQADKQLALAYLLAQDNAVAESALLARQAVKLDGSIQHLLQAGTLVARSGSTAHAKSLLQQLRAQPAIPHVLFAIYCLQLEINLAQGATHSARQNLDKAQALLSPSDQMEWLAHGLSALHDVSGARDAQERMMANPGRLWMYSAIQYPGIWNNTAIRYLGRPLPVDQGTLCEEMPLYLAQQRDEANMIKKSIFQDIDAKYHLFCAHIH